MRPSGGIPQCAIPLVTPKTMNKAEFAYAVRMQGARRPKFAATSEIKELKIFGDWASGRELADHASGLMKGVACSCSDAT